MGRRIMDNVLATDVNMFHWGAVLGHRSTGSCFFDIRAAFPSICHSWIYLVLRAFNFPEFMITAIQLLCSS
eukprot:4039986-Pyramimonas_sp.AAC.1